jgi:hypothetical protein
MPIDNGKTVLISFLQELINSIEQNIISTNQLQMVGEFYMSYMHSTNFKEDDRVPTDKEMIKFLILGWFVYKILLRE